MVTTIPASTASQNLLTESKGEGKIVLQNEIEYQRRRAKEYIAAGNPPPIWDYDDLLEYAEGDIAKVYGPEYAIIDTYRRRVRMPQREYLLCSRVTKLDARTNEYGVAHISTEYDLPINGELSEGGDVPWAILVESGQADLMLISYQGVDFQCKGDRVYRLLDTTLTFYGVAHEGETLCYDIKINSHSYRPGTKEIMMFFFEYNCYVNGRLLIEMRNGVAGFFTDQELDEGKGIIHAPAELKARSRIKKHDMTPFLVCPAKKSSFSEADMQFLSMRGKTDGWGAIMPTAKEINYKLCARKMLMIDGITHVIPDGGAHGLGLIIGEKILERHHWYFPCHFKDDEVMAGSLVSDGCSQLLKVYMIWLAFTRRCKTLPSGQCQASQTRCGAVARSALTRASSCTSWRSWPWATTRRLATRGHAPTSTSLTSTMRRDRALS